MHAHRTVQIAMFLATAVSLSLGVVLSVPKLCFAESNASAAAASQEVLLIREIKFDLGSKEAEEVAEKATLIKRGDVYNREAISSNLRSVHAALSAYWKTRESHTDWLGRLCAYPSTVVGGIRLTIKVAPFYSKPTSILIAGSNSQLMQPISQYSETRPRRVSSLKDGWKYRMDNSEKGEPHCRLGTTEKQRAMQLQDFLEEKSRCYPGYDSETNF